MVSNFLILVLIHLVSDFFFQPQDWALKKSSSFRHLFFHSAQYSLLFIIPFFFLKISFFWVIYLFLTHLAIDNRKFLDWYNKKIKKEKTTPFWVVIVQDQILHLVVLIPLVIWPTF
jgi:hypothetical protein